MDGGDITEARWGKQAGNNYLLPSVKQAVQQVDEVFL